MTAFVIPYRAGGKTRLGEPGVAWAMLRDVVEACAAIGEVTVCDAPGGQGVAVAGALDGIAGPIAVVNSDLPAVTTAELALLVEAAPSIVAASDGTTNAIAIADARDFVPLYGAGSALRFERALGARALDLPGLRDDVDTWDDLAALRDRVGRWTAAALKVRA